MTNHAPEKATGTRSHAGKGKRGGEAGGGKSRAPRWNIPASALAVLEDIFRVQHFPSVEARDKLARQLHVKPRQIQVWFQNRRQRERNSQRKVLRNSEDISEALLGFCSAEEGKGDGTDAEEVHSDDVASPGDQTTPAGAAPGEAEEAAPSPKASIAWASPKTSNSRARAPADACSPAPRAHQPFHFGTAPSSHETAGDLSTADTHEGQGRARQSTLMARRNASSDAFGPVPQSPRLAHGRTESGALRAAAVDDLLPAGSGSVSSGPGPALGGDASGLGASLRGQQSYWFSYWQRQARTGADAATNSPSAGADRTTGAWPAHVRRSYGETPREPNATRPARARAALTPPLRSARSRPPPSRGRRPPRGLPQRTRWRGGGSPRALRLAVGRWRA